MMIQIHHSIIICDALRDLVPFVQFKKLECTHEGVLLLVKLQAKSFTTLLKVTLLHGCFSRFLNCTNGTKSRKTSHIYLACLTHSLKASVTRELGINLFYTTIPCLNSVKEFEASHKVPKKFWTHKVFDRL